MKYRISILITSSSMFAIFHMPNTMPTQYLLRSRPQRAALAVALSGVGLWAVTSYFTRNAYAEENEPASIFPSKLGTSLRLESSESVNHNTKRLRFEFPNPNARTGLTLTCKFPFTYTGNWLLIICSDDIYSSLAKGQMASCLKTLHSRQLSR